jgi:hypothetical protein
MSATLAATCASVSGYRSPSPHVLDADRVVVEPDAVARHRGLGHQPVDDAVAIDEEVGRHVDDASGPHARPALLDLEVREVAVGALG